MKLKTAMQIISNRALLRKISFNSPMITKDKGGKGCWINRPYHEVHTMSNHTQSKGQTSYNGLNDGNSFVTGCKSNQ